MVEEEPQEPDEITLLRSRIAELEAALRPFARCTEDCDGVDVSDLSLGDFRRARAALGEQQP